MTMTSKFSRTTANQHTKGSFGLNTKYSTHHYDMSLKLRV